MEHPKTSNKESGQKAEAFACEWLKGQGYDILHTNYRGDGCELDIVAAIGGRLCFVEVKYRKTDLYGYPEASVGRRKEQNIFRAATAYIEEKQWKGEVRFDIAAVSGDAVEGFRMFYMPDAILPDNPSQHLERY